MFIQNQETYNNLVIHTQFSRIPYGHTKLKLKCYSNFSMPKYPKISTFN